MQMVKPIDNATPPETQQRLIADAGRYWARSDSSLRIQDYSHWRGRGRWADESSWQDWGRGNFRRYVTLATLAGRTSPITTMLEWGPGGGCNAVHFAGEVQTYIGVDVSAANLDECARQIAQHGHATFRGIRIDAAAPEAVLDHVAEPIDFFLCTAVYQHFPSQAYGRRVTRIASDLLKPGGLALIQTRYDDGSEALRCKSDDYERNAITFTSYPVDEFWQHTGSAGLKPLSLELDVEARYAFYLLRKA
jgi:SAM-dependent methyltransferase